VVVGWTDPEGTRPHLGALLLAYYDPDGRLIYAGRAGTGPAGRRMTPSNVSPVVTKRQSAMSSLHANATIIVLRVPRRLSAVRARYHCASALCF
jgi:hypothetical protein